MVPCPGGKENPGGFLFCGFCATALTAPAMPVVQERKVVSILFCDLVGVHTAASERADPEDVRARTQRLLPAVTTDHRALRRHGRAAHRRRRDGGVRRTGRTEDDAERAVSAGLAGAEGDRRAERARPAGPFGARRSEHRRGRRVLRRAGRSPGRRWSAARSSARPSGSSRPRRSAASRSASARSRRPGGSRVRAAGPRHGRASRTGKVWRAVARRGGSAPTRTAQR